MLINPYADLVSFVPSDGTGNVGQFYDLEVCDPVYPDELWYLIGAVSVSDFVFPEWFAPWVAQPDPSRPSLQVDYAKRLDGPTKLAPGAIVSVSNTGRYILNGEAKATETPSAAAARKPSTTIALPSVRGDRWKESLQAVLNPSTAARVSWRLQYDNHWRLW